MTRATLERVYLPTETLGSWYYNGELICKTMELPDRGNQHNISCIPEMVVICKKEPYTEKHPYPHFRISGVPDVDYPNDPTKHRDGILVHLVTRVQQLLGCIGVGDAFKDLNGDGVPDMIGSSIALNKLYNTMPDVFELEIKKKP